MSAQSAFATNAVPSRDGTSIGYRIYGSGPAVVLLQAAIGTTQSYHQFASYLAADFTVYVPERRGRPLSPAVWREDRAIAREVEDVQAMLDQSGARMLFGLSSGAVIALEATRVLSGVTKLVVYEPPLYVLPRTMDADQVRRYFHSVEAGDLPDAMLSALLASGLAPAILRYAPRPVARAALALALLLDARQKRRTYPPLRELVPSLRFDFGVVSAMQGRLDSFGSIDADVLLLSCRKSPAYLREACGVLEGILPASHRVEFEHLDHSGPWNADRGGKPAIVAAAIRDFLCDSKRPNA